MKNKKKLILQILISISLILILIVGLFVFVIKKNGNTEFDEKSNDSQPTVAKTEKTRPEFKRGKEIYISDCNVCHKRRSIINTFSITNGIMKEMGIEYFKKYITKQDSLTYGKDLYASKLKEEYGNAGNSHNFIYSESQLSELIEYIKTKK